MLHAVAPIRIRATPFPPRIERNPTPQVLGRIQTATHNFPMERLVAFIDTQNRRITQPLQNPPEYILTTTGGKSGKVPL